MLFLKVANIQSFDKCPKKKCFFIKENSNKFYPKTNALKKRILYKKQMQLPNG